MNTTDFFKELKEVLEIEDVVLSEQTNLKNIDDFVKICTKYNMNFQNVIVNRDSEIYNLILVKE